MTHSNSFFTQQKSVRCKQVPAKLEQPLPPAKLRGQQLSTRGHAFETPAKPRVAADEQPRGVSPAEQPGEPDPSDDRQRAQLLLQPAPAQLASNGPDVLQRRRSHQLPPPPQPQLELVDAERVQQDADP